MKEKKLVCTLLIVMLVFGVAMVSVGTEVAVPKLFVAPSSYTATLLGEVFAVNVSVANVTDLGAFQFRLGYNTTILDSLDVAIGDFPNNPIPVYPPEIKEDEGYVWIAVLCSTTGGNGTLATITFKATKTESVSCNLTLYNTILGDIWGDPIDHDVEGGKYEFSSIVFTLETDNPYYSPGENIEIFGNLTTPMSGFSYNELVALEVDDPTNNPMVVRTLRTGSNPPPEEITIMQMYTCDYDGTAKTNFKRDPGSMGEQFYINVTVKNNNLTEAKNARIIANAYDANSVSIGVGSAWLGSIGPGTSSWVNIGVYIPEWASLGNATVFVGAFTDWPGRGRYQDYAHKGVPYCPEKNRTFQIIDNGLGAGTVGEPLSGSNSVNFSLTFRLSMNLTAGIHRVYTVFSHKEHSIMNNTVFGVDAIYVPDHYFTIQEAVNAATTTNKSVLVLPGSHNEKITINKSITLVGMNPSKTVIDGSETGTVVTVTANEVEISRFTIQNGGNSSTDSGIVLSNSNNSIVSENTIIENHNGVCLANSSQQNTIRGNTVASNNGYGIKINSSDSNDIFDNTVWNNSYGIYLNRSTNIALGNNDMRDNHYNFGIFGDSLSDFTHNIDTSNMVDEKPVIYWKGQQGGKVPSNAGFVAIVNSVDIIVSGLDLTKNGQGVLFAFTSNSFIEGGVNTINNEYGIYLHQSYNNIITGSSVSNNTVGIHLTYCSGNIICHNNFINNTEQLYNETSANTWNDSDFKGNYWSDYNGTDLDDPPDGVGDEYLPWRGVDFYPLIAPWVLVHDVAVTGVTFATQYNTSEVYPGWKINITVIAKIEGDFTESSFHITAYYNETPIETKDITALAPQKETIIKFTWVTTSVSPGTYTIKATASKLSGETDTTDNTREGGQFSVRKLGDVDGDGEVTALDLKKVKLAIPGYIVTLFADVDGDGEVTALDLKKVKLIIPGYL